MSHPRYLTHEEARIVEGAAEHWLRLGEVEFNAGEHAAALLAVSHLRAPDCTRDDIATLDRTILLEVPGEDGPISITLVRPEDEDLWRGRVSILNELGLACIGQAVGSHVRIPHGMARFIGFADGHVPQAMEESDAHA